MDPRPGPAHAVLQEKGDHASRRRGLLALPLGADALRRRLRLRFVPTSPCRQAQKSKLSLRDGTPDPKDSLQWSWSKGDPTTIEELAPNEGNHYALCLYDESGVEPVLLREALAPGDQNCAILGNSLPTPCWNANSKTVKYLDRLRSPDGLESVRLVPKSQPKSKITLKGRAEFLELPETPLSLPLRVQLQSANGGCWESVFPSAKKNEPGKFQAVAP